MSNQSATAKPVTQAVGADLRKVNAWFEEASQPVKDAALKEKKTLLREKGASLSDKKLKKAWKMKRKLDARIKTLEKRQKVVRDLLEVHYGHMSEDVWLLEGESLGWPSFKTSVKEKPIEDGIDRASWEYISRRELQVQLLLALITGGVFPNLKDPGRRKMSVDDLRKLVIDNIVTDLPSISIAAPSEEAERIFFEKKEKKAA